MPRAFVTILIACLVAACHHEDPGPACPQVVDHMLEVTKLGLTGHGNIELGNRTQMIAGCEQRKYPASVRKCLLGAKDLTQLGNCQKYEPPAPHDPPPPPAVPVGSAH